VILLCVRWYCRYGISYRDLEEMMGERGVGVDHTTLYGSVAKIGTVAKTVQTAGCSVTRGGMRHYVLWLLKFLQQSRQRPAPQQTGEAVQNRLTVEVRQAQEYGF
jgi:hypothetical protein